MTTWIYALIALASGAALAVQVGMNNALRVRVGHPVSAAIISFFAGLVALLGYAAVARPGWPKSDGLFARSPWWIWMGGVVGACYVASAAAFASRLGAAGWLALIVTGQIVASLVLDHFGLVGFPRRPVNLAKLIGVGLLLAGVVVVLTAGGGD